MLESLAAVLTRLRPGKGDDDASRRPFLGGSTWGGKGRAGRGTDASLFQCASCGTVYIATEKRQCSRCDVPVEQVSRTEPHDGPR